MGCRVHTPTRAHSTRWHSGTAWPRASVSQRLSAGRRGTCGSEREWSGGCIFSTHASRPALIGAGGLFPFFIYYSSKGLALRGSRSRRWNWNIPGWVANAHAAHTLLLYPSVQNGCNCSQNPPHNPTAGVNVVQQKGTADPGQPRGSAARLFRASSPHTMSPLFCLLPPVCSASAVKSLPVPCLRLSADGCASHSPP
jgi:hypothetical protein